MAQYHRMSAVVTLQSAGGKVIVARPLVVWAKLSELKTWLQNFITDFISLLYELTST